MVNALHPDYIGFVFYEKSKRFIEAKAAEILKSNLRPDIQSVGVFVNEKAETVAKLLNTGIIDIAQLHGQEDEKYIEHLRKLASKKIIQAFKIKSKEDIIKAEKSSADHILLDSGAGTGKAFNWELLKDIKRPYFLAGGLYPENVKEALEKLDPFAVDVSSGIETDGYKDREKMEKFLKECGR